MQSSFPSAYRCGGSSGWVRICRILTVLIPVELSRRNASTSTNGPIIAFGGCRPVAGRAPSSAQCKVQCASQHMIDVIDTG